MDLTNLSLQVPPIILKTLQPNHAKDIFSLVDINRERLRQYLPWVDHTRSYKDTEVYASHILEKTKQNSALALVIELEKTPVGLISFNEIDMQNKLASMGYWINASHEGQGIVTASAKALINFSFMKMGLNTLYISCGTTNDKSQGVPERLGFDFKETRKDAEYLYDHYVDHNVWFVTKEKWSMGVCDFSV